jgi:chemotaxis protein MotB
MTSMRPLILALSFLITFGPQAGLAQVEEAQSVKLGEGALAFAVGSIQKFTPRDGIVNLITGDNQTTGNRMLLGKSDVFYLKLNNPVDVAVGDLYTVYRRVRKVFHPITNEYLGFVTIRLAVVRVVETNHSLTTVEAIRGYGSTVSPGDLVMRFAPPEAAGETVTAGGLAAVSGMIVELQADKTMTLVSQGDILYLDRGRVDGLKQGDVMDVYRHSAGLPTRKIGQLRVLATEDRTATAKVTRASTRIMRGDRYRVIGYSAPLAQSAHTLPNRSAEVAIQPDLVSSKLHVQDAAGQSRINLGNLNNLLHYDSGEAVIKPDSYQVLDQLIEYLRTAGDERLIRVEGHADNIEIGPSLKSRYASNWDLSKARASGVARYLIEKGGLDSARFNSVGYGDSRPAAPNREEDGRTKNRRVEILLYEPQVGPEGSKPKAPGMAQAPDSQPASLSARGSSDQAAPADEVSATSTAASMGPVDPASTADGGTSAPRADPSANTADSLPAQHSSVPAKTPLK